MKNDAAQAVVRAARADMNPGSWPLPHAPERRGVPMAEDGTRAAGKHRATPPTLLGNRWPANRIDTVVERGEETTPDPAIDLAPGEPELRQLVP